MTDDEIDGIMEEAPQRKRRLPPGISETQAKWIVDSDTANSDVSEDEEEMELDDTDSAHFQPDDGIEEDDIITTEYGDTKSEFFVDVSPEDEAKEYDSSLFIRETLLIVFQNRGIPAAK